MKLIYRLLILIGCVVISIGLFECSYRIFPKLFQQGVDYKSLYSTSGMNPGGYLIPNIDTLVINSYGGKVPWITNSMGFRNATPTHKTKKKNTFRILSIGDSYTAGYRVGQNETFSNLLEQQLNVLNDTLSFEVLIVNTEDPVNGLLYLQKHGLSYNPDLIIWGITLGNDLTQTYLHLNQYGKYHLNGCEIELNEHYNQDSLNSILNERLPSNVCDYSYDWKDLLEKLVTVRIIKSKLSKGNRGESIFASRGKAFPYLFDLSHGLGYFLKDPPVSIMNAISTFDHVLAAYQKLSNQHEIPIVVCLFPQRYQINDADWEQTVKDYDLNKQTFNLNMLNRNVTNTCMKLGLPCHDLTMSLQDYFKTNKTNLYIPMGDMHWNKHGHHAVNLSIYEYLQKQ